MNNSNINSSLITESPSTYKDLEKMNVGELLYNINKEDEKIAKAVNFVIPQIENLVNHLADNFALGGRLFYIGAGTSGRLGVLDASEIPPTFGMPANKIIGLIAGGDTALRTAVENAEDDVEQAWKDILSFKPTPLDTVIGIAASGTTKYVLGGIKKAKDMGLLTAGITNNPGSPLAQITDIPIEINVGPEFVTGSTRMKSGTSQKLVLNMLSTSLMIKLGRVKGNKMIDMQLNNAKLFKRGVKMIIDELDIPQHKAEKLLTTFGSVRASINNYSPKKLGN
ncbi:MAG: N-acetylmuramic acid 6-phosphate etherase [Cyclobacteriaceae bacterium]|nr:N-acetylmuramic acid 6-phosphate etherase [Cyclobacteriaceae bacterium]